MRLSAAERKKQNRSTKRVSSLEGEVEEAVPVRLQSTVGVDMEDVVEDRAKLAAKEDKKVRDMPKI